jgi:hypothetical protein
MAFKVKYKDNETLMSITTSKISCVIFPNDLNQDENWTRFLKSCKNQVVLYVETVIPTFPVVSPNTGINPNKQETLEATFLNFSQESKMATPSENYVKVSPSSQILMPKRLKKLDSTTLSLKQEISSGTFAIVYSATLSETLVAVKVFIETETMRQELDIFE